MVKTKKSKIVKTDDLLKPELTYFQKKAMKKNTTAMNKVNDIMAKLDKNQQDLLMEIFGDNSNLENDEKRKLLSGLLDAYTTPKTMESKTRYSAYEGKRVPL